jgi:hypothetical protein
VALACAAVVAVAVIRPDLSLHGTPPADRPTGAPTGVPSPDVTGTGPSTVVWEPRGDLTRDDGFVQAAVFRIRHDRPEVARVFFAGRLPDGGRLVLAGTDVFRGIFGTAVHALVIEPGADVATSPVTELAPLTDPRQVMSWAGRGPSGHVYAVALSRPGPVRFELSPTVLFDDDGRPSRIWSPVDTEDGLVVADLGEDADPVVTVRATGPGVVTDPVITPVSTGGVVVTALHVNGALAESYRGPDPDRLARGLREVAGQLADLQSSRLQVLWSGAPWKGRRLALVLVTRKDGVRLQALVVQQGSSEFPAGVRALPRDAPAVLPWLLNPFSPADPTFLLCPTGPGTVVYQRPGVPERRLPVGASGAVALVEPSAVAPSASGAVVTLLDRHGAELLTTTLPEPGFDDPLDAG